MYGVYNIYSIQRDWSQGHAEKGNMHRMHNLTMHNHANNQFFWLIFELTEKKQATPNSFVNNF